MTDPFHTNWRLANDYIRKEHDKKWKNPALMDKGELINYHLEALKLYSDLGRLNEEELVNNSYDNYKIILGFLCSQKNYIM